jgi:RNA polymerase sigma factor (TIGR02999 family)
MADVTRIFKKIDSGNPQAAERLLTLVYDELRKLAAIRLANEKPGQTLQATALVHEAYLRLLGDGQENDWNSRGHFFAAAAEAMRRILVEAARRKQSLKRGGAGVREALTDGLLVSDDRSGEVLAIHEALERLKSHDSKAAELVKLRYFVGMQHQEAAEAIGISRREADGLWTLARAWLRRELKS